METNNQSVRMLGKILNHFNRIRYVRAKNEFRIDETVITEYDLKRFIVDNSDFKIDSIVSIGIIKRLKNKLTIQNTIHN